MSNGSEATIIINGQQATDVQSMILRVALDDRLQDLKIESLGQEDRGKQITEDYIQHIHSIQKLITSKQMPTFDLVKQLLIDIFTMRNHELILVKINDPNFWGTSVVAKLFPTNRGLMLKVVEPSGFCRTYEGWYNQDGSAILEFTYQYSWPRLK